MGTGDAYKYGIGIKPENVERLHELVLEIEIMNSILHEEMSNHKPTIWASTIYYTLLPYHHEQVHNITRDNTWMIFLTDDSCHKEYKIIEKYTLVKVKKLFEIVFPKDEYIEYWKTGEFLHHLDEWIYIAHSHYDCHEEWMMEFAVNENVGKRPNYYEVNCCANCEHNSNNICSQDGSFISPAGYCGNHKLDIAFKEE
jgi:hypothetical protein